MRLGQLSRKLSLRPAEIVSFLATKGITIEEGSNTRLEDQHVALLLEKFAPARLTEILQEPDEVEPAPVVVSSPVEELPQVVNEEPALIVSEMVEEKPELIKAPKVELPGLKVLGKIEFPEPKKKATPEVDAPLPEGEADKIQSPERRRDFKRRETSRPDRRDDRPRKNPIALEREREAQAAEQKRREEADRKKELKKQHYHKKVKPVAPTKAARIVEDPVEFAEQQLEEKPRSVVGRLMKWLRS